MSECPNASDSSTILFVTFRATDDNNYYPQSKIRSIVKFTQKKLWYRTRNVLNILWQAFRAMECNYILFLTQHWLIPETMCSVRLRYIVEDDEMRWSYRLQWYFRNTIKVMIITANIFYVLSFGLQLHSLLNQIRTTYPQKHLNCMKNVKWFPHSHSSACAKIEVMNDELKTRLNSLLTWYLYAYLSTCPVEIFLNVAKNMNEAITVFMKQIQIVIQPVK